MNGIHPEPTATSASTFDPSSSKMSQSLLLETLRQVELDQYYSNFSVVGINDVETLVQLTMQDYGIVGVHGMEDRKRL
ncbi:hypothetical protein DFJ77DRAFT_62145 [Powellomyces hirtus]|nr:hypothetical protein DFJ77DRAFT_62145 [Powellomyces hirtus]